MIEELNSEELFTDVVLRVEARKKPPPVEARNHSLTRNPSYRQRREMSKWEQRAKLAADLEIEYFRANRHSRNPEVWRFWQMLDEEYRRIHKEWITQELPRYKPEEMQPETVKE
jgi:hypothetical protein